jgi:hypothetical protein
MQARDAFFCSQPRVRLDSHVAVSFGLASPLEASLYVARQGLVCTCVAPIGKTPEVLRR